MRKCKKKEAPMVGTVYSQRLGPITDEQFQAMYLDKEIKEKPWTAGEKTPKEGMTYPKSNGYMKFK
jgi:hypothetical protein